MRFGHLTACALLLQPLAFAPALANSGSFTVGVHVPLQCDVDITGASAIEQRIVINVRRSCNSHHAMILSAVPEPELGTIAITDSGAVQTLAGYETAFFHQAIFAPENSQIVLDCPKADPATLERFARSISLRMEAS